MVFAFAGDSTITKFFAIYFFVCVAKVEVFFKYIRIDAIFENRNEIKRKNI
jgi:hypothetical protein